MRTMPRRLLDVCSVLLFATSLASLAAAQELLPNGTFDTTDSPYEACCDTHGSVAFDATRDAGGSSHSGAAEVGRFTFSGAFFLSYCIAGPEIEAGKALFFGAKVRFPTDHSAPADAYLLAEFYTDDACAETRIGWQQDMVPHDERPLGTWIPLTVGTTAKGVVLPAGTHGVRFLVGLDTPTDFFWINVDDVFAAPAGTPLCDGMPATIIGDGDDEILIGTDGSDVIVGRGGNDWIDGRGGNDRICGGPGADVLYGGRDDDRLFGGPGADELYGAKGNDFLSGDGGKDALDAGPGLDRLKGGAGNDSCDGGLGFDVAKTCETAKSAS